MEVQVQIERVQVEIYRIDGRLKYLTSRVDYATITVSFREPEPVGSGEGPSITKVINDAIAGFVSVTAALFVLIVSLIPLIILALIAYVLYRWWKGRKKRGAGVAPPQEKKPEYSFSHELPGSRRYPWDSACHRGSPEHCSIRQGFIPFHTLFPGSLTGIQGKNRQIRPRSAGSGDVIHSIDKDLHFIGGGIAPH